MQKELDALQNNNTWYVTTLPQGKKSTGCKWAYKCKLHANVSLERYMAHLVAKGYNQKEGIDYEETFSPVAKMTNIRCMLNLAMSKKWSVFRLDVNNAFLHEDLREEV